MLGILNGLKLYTDLGGIILLFNCSFVTRLLTNYLPSVKNTKHFHMRPEPFVLFQVYLASLIEI